MTERRYPPNRLLAWERLQRGWSYEELAHRVRAEMADCGEGDTGLTANTVRRWETGDRWPEPRFRMHLVVIFGMTASDLGLLTPDELAARPQIDAVTEIRRLMSMAEEQYPRHGSGPGRVPAGPARPRIPPAGRPAGRGEDYERIAKVTGQARPADEGSAHSYARIIAGQRELYWTSPAADLFESAYANAQLGIRLLRTASGQHPRAILSAALGEAAMLAGRLAFFDLRQPAVAQRCYDTALDATREAGDHALAAAVTGHMAFIPAFAHDTAHGLELVEAAQQHCWYGVSPLLRSWLHCVAAETIALSSDPAGYRRQTELAEITAPITEPAPQWFDFYDASRLNGFAGYCALTAGHTGDAVAKLDAALTGLAPTASKQRSVLLADLATAHLDDRDHAAMLAGQALDALASDWYATGHQRISNVIGKLSAGTERDQLRERCQALEPAAW